MQASSPTHRRVIQWAVNPGIPAVTTVRSTGWPTVYGLLQQADVLSGQRKTTVSLLKRSDLLNAIYGHLPKGTQELEDLKDYVYEASQKAARSPDSLYREYQPQLEALLWGVRLKIAEVCCRGNQSAWSKESYRFYLALQSNLGKQKGLHFLTLTYEGGVDYTRIQESLNGIRKNIFFRLGISSVAVIAYHPDGKSEGRLHAHLILWAPQGTRGSSTTAIEQCRAALKEGRYGVGRFKLKPIKSRASALKVMRYVAWNYDRTRSASRRPGSPIPKGARLYRLPQEVSPGQPWQRIGNFTLVTPANTAWRAAVERYARAKGRPMEDLRWIWVERHKIRSYLEPESRLPISITGLDGHTYRVIAVGRDAIGEENYQVRSNERAFLVTKEGWRAPKV